MKLKDLGDLYTEYIGSSLPENVDEFLYLLPEDKDYNALFYLGVGFLVNKYTHDYSRIEQVISDYPQLPEIYGSLVDQYTNILERADYDWRDFKNVTSTGNVLINAGRDSVFMDSDIALADREKLTALLTYSNINMLLKIQLENEW